MNHYAVKYITARLPAYTAAKFSEVREALGIDRQDLADILGISRSTFYRMEKNDEPLAPPMSMACDRLLQLAAEERDNIPR